MKKDEIGTLNVELEDDQLKKWSSGETAITCVTSTIILYMIFVYTIFWTSRSNQNSSIN